MHCTIWSAVNAIDPSIFRHSDSESLYRVALACIGTAEAEGAKRRIDIASIHALAEHQADRSSELTRAGKGAERPRPPFGAEVLNKAKMVQEAGRERNPNTDLDGLVEALLDPVGRRARQQALATGL